VVEMRKWCSLETLDLSGSSGVGSEPHTVKCLHKLLQHSRGKMRLQAQVCRRISYHSFSARAVHSGPWHDVSLPFCAVPLGYSKIGCLHRLGQGAHPTLLEN